MKTKYLFKEIVLPKGGFLRGPFGGDLKKEIFVEKSSDTYKVYEQGVVLNSDKSIGRYYISEKDYKAKLHKFSVQNKDFLVSCSGVNMGAIFQLQEPFERGIINQALLRIRLNQEIIDDNYFLYLFKELLHRKITSGSGDSTIPNFPGLDLIKNISFELPPKDIQIKVGKILSSLDLKIELNNRINAELEAMAKTLYDYWFVQFDFPDSKGKPYKASGGKMVWNEEFKRIIPNGWKVKYISDLAPVVTGKQDANFASENGKYNFYTCGEDILKCDSFEFEGKAVLIAGNGNFNVKLYDGKFNAYQRTYVLIPKNEKYYTIIYMAVKDRIDSFSKGSRGSIVKFITKGDIENIQIALPGDEGIDIFTILNSITEKVEKGLAENQKLTELRNWLLPMLMNGQVKVKEDKEELTHV